MGDLVCVTLNNGVKMPLVGFGTAWESDTSPDILDTALNAGFRCFDTDPTSGNEIDIGQIFKKRFETGQIAREELFITTKAWLTEIGRTDIKARFRQTLYNLQISYIDLFLLHNPAIFENDDRNCLVNGQRNGLPDDDLKYAWKVMETLMAEGLVRALGVSNFTQNQIEDIFSIARVKPSVVQVSCRNQFHNAELSQFSRLMKLQLTAYIVGRKPVRRRKRSDPERDRRFSEDSSLQHVAMKHRRTADQVLLRHHIEEGMTVITNSYDHQSVKSNLRVLDFALDQEDHAMLSATQQMSLSVR